MGLSNLERFIRGLIENPERLSNILRRTELLNTDLVRRADVKQAFLQQHQDIQTISDQAIASAISRFGGCYVPAKVQWTKDGKQYEARVWALRNAEHWQCASVQARAEHYRSPVDHPARKPETPEEKEHNDRLAAADAATDGVVDGGIPFMITHAMWTQLRERGYSDEQIAKMRLADALSILRGNSASSSPNLEDAEFPGSPDDADTF